MLLIFMYNNVLYSMFFPHSHRFLLLFTKVHIGQKENVIDKRILKEMHYTGTGDIRKCPIYRGSYMRGFLLELSLDGTGT